MAGKKGMTGEGMGGVRYGAGRPFGLDTFVVNFEASTYQIPMNATPFPSLFSTSAWALLGRVIRIRKTTILALRGQKSSDPAVAEARRLIGHPDALVVRIGGPVSGVVAGFSFDASRMAVVDLERFKPPKQGEVPYKKGEYDPGLGTPEEELEAMRHAHEPI